MSGSVAAQKGNAKRKSTALSSEAPKRHRGGGAADVAVERATAIEDAKSMREQAELYRIATAKLPINALCKSWRIGKNRPINLNHVRTLARIFAEQGLQRHDAENHIAVACTKAEVQRMIDHLRSRDGDERSSLPWLSFDDWITVNGSEVELMAGQHRVEALKLFLRRTRTEGDEGEQLWWICDFYDRGTFLQGKKFFRTNVPKTRCRRISTSSCEPTDLVRLYLTAMARCGWNSSRSRPRTALSSKEATPIAKWSKCLILAVDRNFRCGGWRRSGRTVVGKP